jgi:hypothetical protein
VGPFANNTEDIFGDYSSIMMPEYTRTVYEGLHGLGSDAVLASGCSTSQCTDYNQTDVQTAVRGSELVVVCLGTGLVIEMEGHDRASVDLPGQQLRLLQDAVKSGQ